MSNIDPCAAVPQAKWSELGVSGLLPTGTVTLLLADVEGSTRLWESQPEEMADAIARLNRAVFDIIANHDGVRPVEQGEGDSFVAAFTRASDAVAAALDLQLAPLAPIRMRIGVHTGEVRLRDEGNYAGSTINRTARLRDLAHGGQTVLSGVTEQLVIDRLPEGAWLTDLGSHPLRDLPRPERVAQLCHPDLCNEFPPLRVSKANVATRLPAQLTSFVGRDAELIEVRERLADNRLVTLTGSGGVGKTRLAVQVASQLADEFDGGVWYVDLAPITDPDVLPIAVARVLGLPDQPGRSTMDTLTRFVADRQMLVVLDNCEHVLDASATLIVGLLAVAAGLKFLATSREPIMVAGEMRWRVPSLSLADEAMELFADRARHVRRDFVLNDDNAAVVAEICQRLDGVALAIELAAARVRALSLDEILNSLHDRFRLLTRGERTAVPRQQTLRASVDWSHALLTQPERVLFRRLALFLGGFNLDAAQAIAGDDEVERYQVLDQLALLVDKSLVVAENTGGRTRYRLLETMRQYAAERLEESGEADAVRARHRGYYRAMVAMLDAPVASDHERLVQQAETEIDNLRAAFTWGCENSDVELTLSLASSLWPLWFSRGHIAEGLAWFDDALVGLDTAGVEVPPALRARALADKAVLDAWAGVDSLEGAEEALEIARAVDDPALLTRALTARAHIAAQRYDLETARACFAEATALARKLNDRWRLSQILTVQAHGASIAGDPLLVRAFAEEGLELADAVGDRFKSRQCRALLATAQMMRGELAGALTGFRAVEAEAGRAQDEFCRAMSLVGQSIVLAYQGEAATARSVAASIPVGGAELGGRVAAFTHVVTGLAALAAGDGPGTREAREAHQRPVIGGGAQAFQRLWNAEAALAEGDLTAALRWADDFVSDTRGWHAALALTIRARVAIAHGERERAERDAHDAVAQAAKVEAYVAIPDAIDCLADLAGAAGDPREAARLFSAAAAARQRMGSVRFKIYDTHYHASVMALRNRVGDKDFDSAWAEGAALSTEDAIAYAQRGDGHRRPSAGGWASLTSAERDVVRLVGEGLGNKDIATRLLVSARTVQTHLTHVYTKLGLNSRVQLVQEATRHA